MPENLAFLLPLLGGYIFTRQWNKTTWYAARWEKERLLLNSALWGVLFFVFADLIIRAQGLWPCISWFPCLPRWPHEMEGVNYLGSSLLAFVFGCLAWVPANYLWSVTKQQEKIIKSEGTLLDILANASMNEQKTVMLTMKSGKVYAGFITSAASPGHSRPMIRILPTSSGYRDKKTQRVIFTTNYSEALEEIYTDCGRMASEIYDKRSNADKLQQEIKAKLDEQKAMSINELRAQADQQEFELNTLLSQVEDFGILVPVDEIASMTLYHAAIHAKYFLKPKLKGSGPN